MTSVALFLTAASANYYASEVGGEAASEAAVIGAVFFDESDLSYCGFWAAPRLGCPALSTEELVLQHAASMVVLSNLTQVELTLAYASVETMCTAHTL